MLQVNVISSNFGQKQISGGSTIVSTGPKLHIIIMLRVVGVVLVLLECQIVLFGACLSEKEMQTTKYIHKFSPVH